MSAALGPAGLEGLRTDQAPPLAIPLSFFFLVPLALAAGGVVLVVEGADALATRFARGALALAHLGTLGVLGAAMLGALYQMVPVVGGRPVPAPRLAHAVHVLYTAGVAALVESFLGGPAWGFVLAPTCLVPAFLAFGVPTAYAMVRAPSSTETMWGMRSSMASLVVVVALGGFASFARAGFVEAPASWASWVLAHAALGGAGWVGGLLTSVSWQVVPMFFLTPEIPRAARLSSLALGGLTLVAVPCTLLVGAPPVAVALAALPGFVAVWGLHPVTIVRALRIRRRRRVDGSVRFWWTAMAAASVLPVLACAAAVTDDPRAAVALGFAAIAAWAGAAVIGTLTRVVPFLVWFHRYSPRVGLEPVPSMRDLLPDGRVRELWILHATFVVVGLTAIGTGSAVLARFAGGVLVALGGALAAAFGRVVFERKRPSPPR